jgi:hypothetical protein
MKFQTPLCPVCFQPANAILEHVPVWADILPMVGDTHLSDSGEADVNEKVDRYEYGDSSNETCWDSQLPLVEGNPKHAKVTLRCEDCEHNWVTTMLRDPSEKGDTVAVYAVRETSVILQTPAPETLFRRRTSKPSKK